MKNKKINLILYIILGLGVYFLSFSPSNTSSTNKKDLKKITSSQDNSFTTFNSVTTIYKNDKKIISYLFIKPFLLNFSINLGDKIWGTPSRTTVVFDCELNEHKNKPECQQSAGSTKGNYSITVEGKSPDQIKVKTIEVKPTSDCPCNNMDNDILQSPEGQKIYMTCLNNNSISCSKTINEMSEYEERNSERDSPNISNLQCQPIDSICSQCKENLANTQTCCGREQGSCLQKSGKGQLFKTFGSRAALLGQALIPGASGNLNKNCQMLKSLMDMSTSLSTASAELCHNHARKCEQSCGLIRNQIRQWEQTKSSLKTEQNGLKEQTSQPTTQIQELEDRIRYCKDKIKNPCENTEEDIKNASSQCMNLAQNIVPVFNRQAVASQYSGGLAQQCAALTGNANGNPFANSNNPPPGSNSPCSGPQAQFLPFCQNPNPRGLGNNNRGGPGFSLDNTGDPSNLLPDMDESPLGAQAFDGHPNSGNFPSSGQVNSPGGGGGGLGAGGGMGGGGSNSLASQTPQKGAGKSGTGPKSILQGFRKGGGYSSPSGSSGFGGGYSSPGGTVDGYGGKGLGKYKGLNLKKYLPKDILAKQKAKQTQRHIASSTTDIFQNVSTRFQTICHKKNLYCNK